MDPQSPDVVNQVPAGGGVNHPASGTYGEQADLQRLKQSLPAPQPVQPVSPNVQSQSASAPVQAPRPAATVPSAGGLPSGLTAPTQRPDVPALPTAPTQPVDPYAGAVDARQRQLRLLSVLAQSQDVSPDTREWAQILLQKLVDASVAG